MCISEKCHYCTFRNRELKLLVVNCIACFVKLFCNTLSETSYRCLHLTPEKRNVLQKQEAFEKCLVHLPLRAAALPFTRCRYCCTPPAHRFLQRRRVTGPLWPHGMGPITSNCGSYTCRKRVGKLQFTDIFGRSWPPAGGFRGGRAGPFRHSSSLHVLRQCSRVEQ